MKKCFVFLALLFTFVFLIPGSALAFDPQTVPNNKFGLHILFPTEIEKVAKIVNTTGGDWGYVTIPIEANDKDLQKWQKFMDDAKRLHLIPIIRLATNGDYFNTAVWDKPSDADIVDFANFLNSLDWPTKNRYVVIYNEVNRNDEWDGNANPQEYASILSYAVTVFKSKSSDFFILSAGLDNAASNSKDGFNEYTFLSAMNTATPGIFNQIDGITSHAYPNPGFSCPPNVVSSESIYSFKSEEQLVDSLSNRKLPTFITETGWSSDKIPDSLIAQYFKTAFDSAWNNPRIVAVTPFLLEAGSAPFNQFSFEDQSGNPNLRCQAVTNYPKTKGAPILNETSNVLGIEQPEITEPIKNFKSETTNDSGVRMVVFKSVLKWFLRL
jgi:hypothetical protein